MLEPTMPAVLPLRYTISFHKMPGGWMVRSKELQSGVEDKQYFSTGERALNIYKNMLHNVYKSPLWRIAATSEMFTVVEWAGNFSNVFDHEKSKHI